MNCHDINGQDILDIQYNKRTNCNKRCHERRTWKIYIYNRLAGNTTVEDNVSAAYQLEGEHDEVSELGHTNNDDESILVEPDMSYLSNPGIYIVHFDNVFSPPSFLRFFFFPDT